MYVYTEYGEARAKALGFDDRKAGAIAMCGHKPVSGQTAQDWLAKGYIAQIDTQNAEEIPAVVPATKNRH